jgi:hypothetical protein
LIHGCRNSRPPSRLGNGRSHPIYDTISRRAGAAFRRRGIPGPTTSAGPEPQRLPAGWPICSIPATWTNQAVSRHTETAGSHAACAPSNTADALLLLWIRLGGPKGEAKMKARQEACCAFLLSLSGNQDKNRDELLGKQTHQTAASRCSHLTLTGFQLDAVPTSHPSFIDFQQTLLKCLSLNK